LNNEEVHIIKIGEIIGPIGERKAYLMVDEDDDINKYYVNIVREHFKDTHMIMKSSGIIRQPTWSSYTHMIMKSSGIIRQPTWSSYNTFVGMTERPVIGIPDGEPIIGKSFTINNSSWHTSEVKKIIENDILVTRNSVYLLYNKSNHRDRIIKDLGV